MIIEAGHETRAGHRAARLAMKLAYKALNDSDPPAGTLRTDTITTVALVYDFSPQTAAAAGP